MLMLRRAPLWRLLALVCAALLLVPTAGSAAESFTMREAVERALEANPGVEAKLLALEQARKNVGVAQSYFWPRVSLVANANRLQNDTENSAFSSDEYSSDTRLWGVRASLSLFAGFAHLNNLQKSRLAVDVEEARHKQARLELECNVQLQFLQLLRSREDLKTAEEAVARIQTQLQASEQFVKVGMAPYVNVLLNRTELSSARQQVIRVRNDIRNAQVQLNAYLGFPPGQDVHYAGRLRDFHGTVNLSEAEAVERAVRQRPDLMVARKSVDVARKDMQATMGSFLPRVDATYDNLSSRKDFDTRFHRDYSRRYWAVGLNFSWELFSGGGTTFATQAERKRVQALEKEYENAVSGARADVIRALLDIQTARELVGTAEAGVDAARESYAMANKRYLTNIGTITELLDAQLKLTQAENDASRALADYHGALVRFSFAIGRENPGLE